jgi:hypothetical protein
MKKAIFSTVLDQHQHLSGREVEVIEPVNPATYDQYEVGTLWIVRFDDGTELQAWENELSRVE